MTALESPHEYIETFDKSPSHHSHSHSHSTPAHTNTPIPLSSSSSSSSNVDDILLFAYFGGIDQTETLHYAYSIDGTHWNPLARNKPVAICPITNVTIRDPYVHLDQQGAGYHLVATNGHGFGYDSTIVYAYSKDLITWEWKLLDVFSSVQGWIAVWAPEFKWDPVSSQYMIFWAGLVNSGDNDNCTNSNTQRWKFWYTMTSDFSNFTIPPTILFDPGCDYDGMGGIDGTIMMDEQKQWNIIYKDARGSGESVRGIRRAISAGGITGPYSNISPLISQTLVEAPEIIQWQNQWLMYYDCSFMKTPNGWPRPPYGVSKTNNLHDATFSEIAGSCTGSSTMTSFPVGATHGSFLTISLEIAETLINHFGQ